MLLNGLRGLTAVVGCQKMLQRGSEISAEQAWLRTHRNGRPGVLMGPKHFWKHQPVPGDRRKPGKRPAGDAGNGWASGNCWNRLDVAKGVYASVGSYQVEMWMP